MAQKRHFNLHSLLWAEILRSNRLNNLEEVMAEKMILCKACGKEIAKSAKTCPHCGKRNKKSKFLSFLIVIGVIILIFNVPKILNNISENKKQPIKSDKDVMASLAELGELANTKQGATITSLELLGYYNLRSQILGEYTPKVSSFKYPLKNKSSSYALFGIKVLRLKEGDSARASFNYTITSVDMDKFIIGVEQTDFKSDTDSKVSLYYFGDIKAFGADGPQIGQNFIGYVTYHASAKKIGIALPIIVLDGVKIKKK